MGDSRTSTNNRYEHAPTCPVIRKCDLHPAGENENRIRRNVGESLEDYYAAVEELPYIGMAEVEKMEPCSLEMGEVEENQLYLYKYVWQGKLYQNGSTIRLLLKDGRKYIVEVQKLPDPSGGLFGAFGRWSPYRTVLYDGDGNEIAEHAEIHGADFGRIDAVMDDKEQLLRWLTLHRMIRSDYAQEISEINEKLRALWKTYFDTEDTLKALYYQRLGSYPGNRRIWLAYFDGERSYEEFMESRKDLFFSDKG